MQKIELGNKYMKDTLEMVEFMSLAEKAYGKTNLLPLEELEVENQCGYIFKGRTNQMTYV